MSEEILQEVRSEVDQSANSLRGDVAGMLERREETSNQKLTQLDEKMEQVVSWAKCGYVALARNNWLWLYYVFLVFELGLASTQPFNWSSVSTTHTGGFQQVRLWPSLG